ncbi:MAG: hypothetical protein AAGD43_02080, partial [Pseudomonadota bacterium]
AAYYKAEIPLVCCFSDLIVDYSLLQSTNQLLLPPHRHFFNERFPRLPGSSLNRDLNSNVRFVDQADMASS